MALTESGKFYRQAHFLTSAAKLMQAPPDEGVEVAFVGRSNAGKSSAINRICDQKSLARTSRTPGRTQLLNFFTLSEQQRLVDLPGYGFAKVGLELKREWQGALADYLERRQCLRGLIQVMDIRHPCKETDLQLLAWAADIGLRVHVLLTKADKVNRRNADDALARTWSAIEPIHERAGVQVFSARKGYGLTRAHQVLDNWLERKAPAASEPSSRTP